MALLVFSTAVKLPCTVFGVGLYIQQKLALANMVSLCGEFLRVTLLAVLLFGVRTSVLSVVIANVVTELSVTVAVMLLSLRLVPAVRFRIREIQWSCARELVSFGGWNFLGLMAYRMRETLVLMILNRQATPLDVTVFNVGYQGRRQIDAWTDLMAGPLYPVVTSMHAIGAKDRIRSVYMRGGRIALWIMLLVGLPAAIYATTVIRLYATQPYIEAAVVMVLTLAGLPITGGSWMIWQVANATGRVRATSLLRRPDASGRSYCCPLIPCTRWDGEPREWHWPVWSSESCRRYFLLWPLGLRLSGATFEAWTRETLVPGLTPGCVAGVVWAALNVIVQPNSWAGLGVCTAIGVLCYLTVLLAFCLEPRDREDLAKMVAKAKNLAQSCFGGAAPRGSTPSSGLLRPAEPPGLIGYPHVCHNSDLNL